MIVVDVMLSFVVNGEGWCAEFLKLVKMPALIPAGADIIIKTPNDWDLIFAIPGYYWDEEEAFLRTSYMELKPGEESYEEWKTEFELAGWTVGNMETY